MRRALLPLSGTPDAAFDSDAPRDPDLAPDPDAPPPRSGRHAGPARVLATLALAACIAASFAGSGSRGHGASAETAAAGATIVPVEQSAVPGSTAEPRRATAPGPDAAPWPDATRLAALQLVAHVEMARTALAADLVPAARQHVGEALPLASRLVQVARAEPRAESAATPLSREAWIALQNEEHLVRTPAEVARRGGGGAVLAADARAVSTRRTVDAARVLDRLEAAAHALAVGDTRTAARALDDAGGSVVAETSVRDLPLQRVQDDLDLAQRLAAAGDDDGAGDALDYARAAFADAGLGDPALGRTADAAGLRRRIDATETQLALREPAGIAELRDAALRRLRALGTWLEAAHVE
jgi:hypothetical protein